MIPADSWIHQKISGSFYGQVWNFLKNKKCEVYSAPFDVPFPSKDVTNDDDKIYTVMPPDICIICNESKLDNRGCPGTPDLIVEIVSLSTVKKDIEDKFKIYQESGDKEYWIVQPNDATLTVFFLENGKFQHKGMYTRGSIVPVLIFDEELLIDLDEVFT